MRRVTKSRGGCTRCKGQRLKCDEAKPACGRCVRLGVTCPGYVKPPLKWSTKHEALQGKKAGPKAAEPKDDTTTATVASEENTNFDVGEPLFESSAGGWIEDTSTGFQTAAPTVDEGLRVFDMNDPLNLGYTDTFFDPFGAPATSTPNFSGLGFGSSPMMDEFNFLQDQNSSQALTKASGTVRRGGNQTYDGANSISFANPSLSGRSDRFLTPMFGRQTIIPSPTRALNDTSSVLIEYYFKEVAGVFSCYDSQMNPFRSTVAQLWHSSPAIYYTLQSMAAACLANDFPHLGREGIRLRRKAASLLGKETEIGDKQILALLMLGQTTSWHDSKDLGISFFNSARKCLDTVLSENSSSSSKFSNNIQFFQEALLYWEMLLSYVTEDHTIVPSGTPMMQQASDIVSLRAPHPWTGFARDAQLLVHEVGKLVRKERTRLRVRNFSSLADIDEAKQAIEVARTLEERLLDLVTPEEPNLVSPGDGDTPIWHLLTIAEVYRRTGLTQIYRAFPDLLVRRLPPDVVSNPTLYNDHNFENATTSFLEGSPWFETPEESQSYRSDSKSARDNLKNTRDDWLTSFAIGTLNLLKSIPIESRTRCLQPFLLVASSSELRLPASSQTTASGVNIEVSWQSIEISMIRKFILGRLTSYLHILPSKPIHVCLKLVKETWSKIDAGEENVYWVDTMIENGWETTMG